MWRVLGLVVSALLLQACASGTRPFVAGRYEVYKENYKDSNPRFGSSLVSTDAKEMSIAGPGVEIGLINTRQKYSAMGSIAYTKFSEKSATEAVSGQTVAVDPHALGANLVLGYNLLSSPLMLRPEVQLRYQTYSFKRVGRDGPSAYQLVSHSYAGAGLALQIPLGFMSIVARGAYSIPMDLDNAELSQASSIEATLALVIGGN